MELDIALAAAGEHVGLGREAVALPERIVGVAGQRGRPRAAGQPDRPLLRMPGGQLAQAGRRASRPCSRRRLPASSCRRIWADPCRGCPPARRRLGAGPRFRRRPGCRLRRASAAGRRCRCSRAPRRPRRSARRPWRRGPTSETADRRASGVTSLLSSPGPADLHDARVQLQAFDQLAGHRQRLKVSGNVIAAGDAILVAGQFVLGVLGPDRGSTQGRGVHAERAEQLDVAPALEVLRNSAAFVDGDRQAESGRTGRPPARPGRPENCDAGAVDWAMRASVTGRHNEGMIAVNGRSATDDRRHRPSQNAYGPCRMQLCLYLTIFIHHCSAADIGLRSTMVGRWRSPHPSMSGCRRFFCRTSRPVRHRD